MAHRGYAVVVGVSKPPNASYLSGVRPDVEDFSRLLQGQGFEVTPLLDGQGTSAAILGQIKSAAQTLRSGDLFVFTFSGHGAQTPNSGDDDEAKDQLLMTADGHIVDDQLGALWRTFESGVRIVVVTDSCHSGSVVRELQNPDGSLSVRELEIGRPRLMSIGLDMPATRSARDATPGNIEGLRASLIHLAACRDPEVASDIGNNGEFTHAFMQAWRVENESYATLFEGIKRRVRGQTPQMWAYGAYQSFFLHQAPFAINVKWPPMPSLVF